jgi:2-polyprenyl-6-methoxyphenol hydroxylase-like FAD-dependent oxidoreductase
MAKLDRILIAGGGIAGLTAAVALRQRGYSPEILERSPSCQAVGAGIAIQPNAMRALRRLGIGAAVEQAGTPLRRFACYGREGQRLCAVDLEELWADVGPCVGIERPKLQEALLSAADRSACRLGTSIASLRQTDRQVSVVFGNGEVGDYDLVIGADGIASTVRELALGSVSPSYEGQMVWRSLAPMCPEAAEIQFWLGDGCFFGLVPVGNGRVYGFGNVAEPRRHDPVQGRLARLRDRFAAFAPPVRTYLAALEDDAEIHCGPIEWLELGRWHEGRIVLIGDAAHASSPMMGQGGCMAIEDALVLAELVCSAEDTKSALDGDVRRRRPRVDWVQKQSRAQGDGLYLPPNVRDAVLRERGETMFRDRYAPLLTPP